MTVADLHSPAPRPIRRPVPVASAYHGNILMICLLTVAAAFSLRLAGNDRVAFFFAPGHPLPNLCLCRAWFGFNCPGCGLTRSFVCLSQGRWHAAEAFHPMGWLIAAVVVFQIPYRFACMLGCRPLRLRWLAPLPWVGLAALFAVWIVRMF